MNPNAIITKRKVKLNWQSKKKKTMIPKILNSKEKKSIFFIGRGYNYLGFTKCICKSRY